MQKLPASGEREHYPAKFPGEGGSSKWGAIVQAPVRLCGVFQATGDGFNRPQDLGLGQCSFEPGVVS
jgi:hypothetical protein